MELSFYIERVINSGKPYFMFTLSEIFGKQDYLDHVDDIVLKCCVEECVFRSDNLYTYQISRSSAFCLWKKIILNFHRRVYQSVQKLKKSDLPRPRIHFDLCASL